MKRFYNDMNADTKTNDYKLERMVRRIADMEAVPVVEFSVFESGLAVERNICEVLTDPDGYLVAVTCSGVERLGFQPKEIALFQALDESGSGWEQAFAAEPAGARLPRTLLQCERARFRPQVELPKCDQSQSQSGPAQIPQFYRSVRSLAQRTVMEVT